MSIKKVKIKEQIKEIEKQNNIKILYCSYVGSKLYGTDNEKSDTDLRFIYKNKIEDIILGEDTENLRVTRVTKEKNTSEDIDFDGWNLKYFLELVKKSDTNAVDLVFSMFNKENIVYEDKNFTKEIKRNYQKIINKQTKGFVGYCLAQVKKFGIKGERYEELQNFINKLKSISEMSNILKETKLEEEWNNLKYYLKEKKFKYIKFTEAAGPNNETWEYISVLGRLFHKKIKFDYFLEKVVKIENEFGNRTKNTASLKQKIDPKSTYHALRIAMELKELLQTNFIKFPLKETEKLKKIKSGDFIFEETIKEIEWFIDETEKLVLNSDLKEESDNNYIKTLILKEYGYGKPQKNKRNIKKNHS